MPVYEFHCPDCNVLFSFFSPRVNTSKIPACPRCGRPELIRQMSVFSVSGNRPETEDGPLEDPGMERALSALAGEAAAMDENDPKKTAGLMRKFSKMAGLGLGPGMEEALSRMEAGESPEAIEAEMGSVLENEEPVFQEKAKSGGRAAGSRPAPGVDPTLYDL
jgi:putative FmdB family regulatory protein